MNGDRTRRQPILIAAEQACSDLEGDSAEQGDDGQTTLEQVEGGEAKVSLARFSVRCAWDRAAPSLARR